MLKLVREYSRIFVKWKTLSICHKIRYTSYFLKYILVSASFRYNKQDTRKFRRLNRRIPKCPCNLEQFDWAPGFWPGGFCGVAGRSPETRVRNNTGNLYDVKFILSSY